MSEQDRGTDLLPPDERFWKRYSHHQELPLAGATSLVLHGLALACVVLAGLALSFRWHSEEYQPPRSEVVFVEAFAGDGGAPGGSDPGLPGKHTEAITPQEVKATIPALNVTPPKLEPFQVTPMPETDDPVPSVTATEAKKDTVSAADIARRLEEKLNNVKPTPQVQPKAAPSGQEGGGGL